MFGNTMLLHGGINEKEVYSNEMHLINFNGSTSSNISSPIIISSENRGDKNHALAYHKLINTSEV
jgi:hypothetical protein